MYHRLLRNTTSGISRSGLRCLCGISSGSSAETRVLDITRLDGDLNGVVKLEMNSPKANALGFRLLSELEDAVGEISADESIRAVVLSSAVPGVFCAGADLKERATMSHEETELFVSRLRSLMSQVASIPAPTIAAVEGAAFGGGLELILACDLRVVGELAMMALTETSLGIIPGAGGTQRLPRLIGASKAKELIFTARRLGAARALELGMVNTVVGAGQAEKEALSTAGEIATRGPLAVRAAKLAINEGLSLADAERGMGVERRMYARVLGTQDRDEGLAAFKDRRPPVFTGK
ncbi:unnamed protein product [Pylaiella littoralis]